MQADIHISYPPQLPISGYTGDIIEAIHNNQVIVVAGDTGSGKTTQLPKMCLAAGRGRKGKIGCTQPRRIAATSVAARVAEELQVSLGEAVGYKIRFHDKTSKHTRVKFMTDGILLAELHNDQLLRRYDTIIIDEAHERSLNIDFLLGVLRRLLSKRRDLKVIITSATIDTEKFSKCFDNAPIISVEGRTFPVEVRYQPIENEEYVDAAVEAIVTLHTSKNDGDILVFMPTERDIRETVEAVSARLRNDKQKRPAVVLPLFGRLSGRDQVRIFQRANGRKIVVATNVAETSITVSGIRYVVDTGLARIAGYNVRARTTKMPVSRISRASCDQRAGRCGRVGPGICIRLFSEDDFLDRHQYSQPEILRANLADVILRMLAFRLGEPQRFPFVDPPSPRAIKDGYALLHELGALYHQKTRWSLTKRGRFMARLPLDPQISRMVIEGRQLHCLREICIIAAALSIGDPRVRPAEKEQQADTAHAAFKHPQSDFMSFVLLWDKYRALKSSNARRKFCVSSFLSWQRMREWRDIHDQILIILDEEKGFHVNKKDAPVDNVHQAILSGHLRTIGIRKEKNEYTAAGSKPCFIFPGSNLYNKAGEWIMAAELVETSRLYARCVATIKPQWLEPLAKDLCRYSWSEPHWEKRRGQVVCFEKVSLFGLTIVGRRRVAFAGIDREKTREIFIQSALVEGELAGNYGFLEHNLALIKELQDMEDRLRSRTVLVSDEEIGRFYEKTIPAEVYDQRSLAHHIKKVGDDQHLRLARTELVREKVTSGEIDQFPSEIINNTIVLPISYNFSPGADDDGVSVHIPIDLIDRLDPGAFHWLVPGLLEEKVIAMLKGLPKGVRRRLVPVGETARHCVAAMEFGKGSLFHALEREIYRYKGVQVTGKDWVLSNLPSHLAMRFCLQRKGKSIRCSRKFTELLRQDDSSSSLESEAKKMARRFSEVRYGEDIFDTLPEKQAVFDKQQRLLGYVHPALKVEDGGKISVQMIADEDRARAISFEAVLGLYRNHFKKQWKTVLHDIAIPKNKWHLIEGLTEHGEFDNQLRQCVLREIFSLGNGVPSSRQSFEQKVAEVKKKGLYPWSQQIFSSIIDLLERRRQSLNLIHSFEKKARGMVADRLKDIRHHVEVLVPSDFLLQSSVKDFTNIVRYLEAIDIRLQRLILDPAKDTQKCNQLDSHLKRLEICDDRGLQARKKLLAEYRQMIEEFRVSLFAQELKTAFPISAKKLDKKWKEIENCIG